MQSESSELAGLTFYTDMTAMKLHDGFDDGQAETRACIAATSVVDAVETVENALDMFSRDTWPLVADAKFHGCVI